MKVATSSNNGLTLRCILLVRRYKRRLSNDELSAIRDVSMSIYVILENLTILSHLDLISSFKL